MSKASIYTFTELKVDAVEQTECIRHLERSHQQRREAAYSQACERSGGNKTQMNSSSKLCAPWSLRLHQLTVAKVISQSTSAGYVTPQGKVLIEEVRVEKPQPKVFLRHLRTDRYNRGDCGTWTPASTQATVGSYEGRADRVSSSVTQMFRKTVIRVQ